MCFKYWFTKNEIIPERESSFLELLSRHEEFAFTYNGVGYEIVYGREHANGDIRLLFFLCKSEPGTLLRSFDDWTDFLKNGTIEEKRVFDILDEIKV